MAARRKHPRWGPKKLLVIVKRQHPRVELPAASTVGAIFKKHGLIGRQKRVRRSDPYKDRLGPYDAANRVWCADFKGKLLPRHSIDLRSVPFRECCPKWP
jgi:hypothetical protein